MSIEIELRYQVLNAAGLDTFLRTLSFLHKKRVVDIYLDTANADLIKRGIYIRIRDNAIIDIKFNRACLHDPALGLQAYCEEYSFALPLAIHDVEKLNKVSLELGLKTTAFADFEKYRVLNHLIDHRIVDKMRFSYSTNEFTVVVDEVKGLGTCIEIELMAEEASALDAIKYRMQETLAGLHLKPLETGYDSLILRKQNFEQYLRGRFILEEDKKYLKNHSAPLDGVEGMP